MNRIYGSVLRSYSFKSLSTIKCYEQKRACKLSQINNINHQCYSTDNFDDGASSLVNENRNRNPSYASTNRNVCHRCGKPGHFAAECTMLKACYRCGSESHTINNCPQTVCYRCMKPGHSARDCTEVKSCYRCGKSGHIARDCTEAKIENM